MQQLDPAIRQRSLGLGIDAKMPDATNPWKPTRNGRRLFFAIATVHLILLLNCAVSDSFTIDEVAHLPSGLYHWTYGQFGMYRVNPPLVRMVATAPLLALNYKSDWAMATEEVTERPEWQVAQRFLELNGERSFLLLLVARLACLPFSLLGLWICWRWAGSLFGDAPATLAATIWCFSPNILAHGHLITPDLAGSAIGITAFYLFWNWLRRPTWWAAFLAGLAFGQAQAAKSSWVILFLLWPMLWVVWQLTSRTPSRLIGIATQLRQLCAIILVGVWSLNMWYGADDTLLPLGDYRFISRSLTGKSRVVGGEQFGNRFAGTWLGCLPVPLPREYLQGIDRQKYHFERPDVSYLRGEWRDHGWWYYYLYAVLIKEPIGAWIVAATALLSWVRRKAYRAALCNEIILVAPLILLLLLVSSQQGFNRHLRYILPAFPFAIIWVSRIGKCVTLGERTTSWVVLFGMLGSICSMMASYPHPLSYFNELVGGPKFGHRHLLGSNTDWGQDLLYLRSWIRAHPNNAPLHMRLYTDVVDPRIAGISYHSIPAAPTPGWYAISINCICDHSAKYSYFRQFEPVAFAGYSIWIYELSDEDCEKIQQSHMIAPQIIK